VLDPAVQLRLIRSVRAAAPAPATRTLPAELTPREVQVLTLIGQGMSNRGIARELFVSETTVKTHINHLFAKADLADRGAAVRLARDCGLPEQAPR
nr:LuxR C-terminal-related transcriptional regulator [Actinomycetota bacterium]